MEEAARARNQYSTEEVCQGTLTNFPIGDSPCISHPVCHIRTPIPRTFRWRNRIEIGIGSIFRYRETALLLTNLEAEAGKATSELTDAAGRYDFDRRRGRGALLLAVERLGIRRSHVGDGGMRQRRLGADRADSRSRGTTTALLYQGLGVAIEEKESWGFGDDQCGQTDGST